MQLLTLVNLITDADEDANTDTNANLDYHPGDLA